MECKPLKHCRTATSFAENMQSKEQNKVTGVPPSQTLVRPHLALPLGDPAGIGSEIVLKALADPLMTQDCAITVIGSRRLLESAYQSLKSKTTEALADPETLDILDITPNSVSEIKLGRGNAASGEASFAYLETAIAHTLTGEFSGIVTAPIAKSLWKAAGYDYPGQTEVLAQRAGVSKYGMLFVAQSPHTGYSLRTLLATTHIPLRDVSNALTPELMGTKLDLLVSCLQTDFGISNPKIAISGLNPHSGEDGQLGTEERDWINAWLEGERQKRPQIQLAGLVPPDTLWVNVGNAWYSSASSKGVYDGYLALYHDQGLIPVKLLAFDQAINTTIGLPFIRTSPDHGTAFDIAGQGIARDSSLKAAIQLAMQLTKNRLHERMAQ